MMRYFWTLCSATLAVGVALEAQQPGAQVIPDQRPPVTFRTETNFVEIDAIVTDRDGRFVAGLTKDDFELFEEGKPQQISSCGRPVMNAGTDGTVTRGQCWFRLP